VPGQGLLRVGDTKAGVLNALQVLAGRELGRCGGRDASCGMYRADSHQPDRESSNRSCDEVDREVRLAREFG
jgi:hypothetical protein